MGVGQLSCGRHGKSQDLIVLDLSDAEQDAQPPRTANGNAIKHIKAVSKAYEALGEAYSQLGNLPKLKAQIKAGADTWAEVSPSSWERVDHHVRGANMTCRMETWGS